MVGHLLLPKFIDPQSLIDQKFILDILFNKIECTCSSFRSIQKDIHRFFVYLIIDHLNLFILYIYLYIWERTSGTWSVHNSLNLYQTNYPSSPKLFHMWLLLIKTRKIQVNCTSSVGLLNKITLCEDIDLNLMILLYVVSSSLTPCRRLSPSAGLFGRFESYKKQMIK